MQPQSCVVLKSTLVVGIISEKSVVEGKGMVNRFHNVIVHFYWGTPISADNATNEAQNLFTSYMFLCHGPSLWKPCWKERKALYCLKLSYKKTRIFKGI